MRKSCLLLSLRLRHDAARPGSDRFRLLTQVGQNLPAGFEG